MDARKEDGGWRKEDGLLMSVLGKMEAFPLKDPTLMSLIGRNALARCSDDAGRHRLKLLSSACLQIHSQITSKQCNVTKWLQPWSSLRELRTST